MLKISSSSFYRLHVVWCSIVDANPGTGGRKWPFYVFNMDEGTQTRPFVDYTIPSLALLQGKYWIPTLNSEELFSQKNGKDTSFLGRIHGFF